MRRSEICCTVVGKRQGAFYGWGQTAKLLLFVRSRRNMRTFSELQGEGDTTTMKQGIALIVATGTSKEVGRLKLVRGNGNAFH